MNIGASMIKIAVTGLLLGGSLAGSPAGATGMVQLGQVAPQLAHASFAGHHDPRAVLDISMALQLRNAAGLDAFLHDLQDPSSPNYHKFLTEAQFTAAYGPTQAQVDAVKAYLQQHGFIITSVSKGRTRIHAVASTATVETAFGVAVNDYTYQGGKYFAATTGPSLPSDIAGLVHHVFGLENMVQYRSHLVPSAHSTTGVGPQGYSPQQIATAYGWPKLTVPLNTKPIAAGVKIAIATAFTYRTADVQKFWSAYGLPSHKLTNIPIDGTTKRLDGETTLDVEHSSVMSPGSAILVYESVFPGDQQFDDMFQQIADDDTADVVSTSWGLAESSSSIGSMAAEHAAFQKMAAEGMTFFAAAGDNGSADQASGNDNADFPSSDPYTVSAGGTSLFLNSDNTIASETAWSGAGGADSILFAEPGYQTSTAGWVSNTACNADHTGDFPDGALAGGGCTAAGAASRQNSDIAMDADPATSYSFYYNGRWSEAGGTSFVAPQLAGMFAIVTARLRAKLASTTARVGQGNPVIYTDAALNPSDFNDIAAGSNGLFSAGAGWDHPTGWGTPHNANTFTKNLVTILTTP